MFIHPLYVDPATTTMIIQVAAGVVIAIGAFFAVFWRKAKKKVADKLGIDENKNKEVEDELILTDSTDVETAEAETEVAETETADVETAEAETAETDTAEE